MGTQASDKHTYDYIVVGAGSAGCVLANRLSQNGAVSVLVIEAGGRDWNPLIRVPLGWGQLLTSRLHDWMYFSEPEPHMLQRPIECARGRVLGGSSAVNAMAYVRGHASDYDRWAQQHGMDGWAFQDVLPYFRRQESWEDGSSAYRGGQGPLSTQRSKYSDPLVASFQAAAAQQGYPPNDDYNGARQDGFGIWQSTIRRGRRCSAADAYLKPVMHRPNLRLVLRALATRVVLDGNRAVGVSYRQGGREVVARARCEVILAGGVINSPQMLMLSGIGAASELEALGIPVAWDLPGVGKNLQDHISASIAFSKPATGAFHRMMRLDRVGLAMARAYLFGSGMATDLPAGLMGFVRTRREEPAPDLQFLFNAGSLKARPYLWPLLPGFEDTFSCRAVLLRPRSRGEVRLQSADPTVAPKIMQNFFSVPSDIEPLREGLRIIRRIVGQEALRDHVVAETADSAAAVSDADLDHYIRRTGITVHHPAGTCRMGKPSDPGSVVDGDFKVHGADRLRVVDASAMPDLVGGNINAAVIMMAEKASDLILNKPPAT